MQIWDLAQLIRAQTTKIYDSLINFLKIIWIKWYTLKFEQTKLNLFLNKSSRLKYKSKKNITKKGKIQIFDLQNLTVILIAYTIKNN